MGSANLAYGVCVHTPHTHKHRIASHRIASRRNATQRPLAPAPHARKHNHTLHSKVTHGLPQNAWVRWDWLQPERPYSKAKALVGCLHPSNHHLLSSRSTTIIRGKQENLPALKPPSTPSIVSAIYALLHTSCHLQSAVLGAPSSTSSSRTAPSISKAPKRSTNTGPFLGLHWLKTYKHARWPASDHG